MDDIRLRIARLCHEAFLRRGVFETLATNRVPCSTAREVPLIGEAAALELARASYLITRHDLLGYTRLAVREKLSAKVGGLIARGSEVAAPYSVAALGQVAEARRVARQLERRCLTGWQRVREGEYRADIREGRVELLSDFDIYQGCPDLVLLFPAQRLSLQPEHFFAIDTDAYLAFEDISEFERRYEVVLALIDHVRRELTL